jgi:hypothetical protein
MLGRLRLTVVLLALLLPWHGAAQAWLVALGPAHHHAWNDAAVEQVCCAPAPLTHHHDHSARHHHADDDDSVLLDHEHDEELTDTQTAGAAAQPALPVGPAGCLPPGEVVQSPGLIPVWRSVSQQPPQRPPSALQA